MFQTYDKKQFANVIPVDENWIYYFEPIRKVSNKTSATKHSIGPIIVKRSLSARFLALLPMVYIFLGLFVLLACALMLMTSTTETYF